MLQIIEQRHIVGTVEERPNVKAIVVENHLQVLGQLIALVQILLRRVSHHRLCKELTMAMFRNFCVYFRVRTFAELTRSRLRFLKTVAMAMSSRFSGRTESYENGFLYRMHMKNDT